MYVIQKIAAQAGGLFGAGHNGYSNLYHIDAGQMFGPIATIAEDRLAERIRDLLNQHGMEGADLAFLELPPPTFVVGGGSDHDDDD